jgi:O-antigen/teichoic acid export membrane protein
VRGAMFIIPAVLTESIEWLMIGGLAFCTVRVITLLAYLKKEFKGELGVDVSLLKQQFAYTVPYALAIFVEVIQQNYHQYVVSWKWDPATFAIYSVGCLQIPLVDFIASPASNVMMVRIGEELREGRRKSILAIWNDTNRKLALVFFPLIGLLVVNAYRIITLLFTSEFIASVPIFMVWSLTIAFAIFQTDGVLRALAQTRFLIVMNLARLAAIIGLMEWSLSRFQLVGPVIVTIVGVAVARFIALMRIRKLLEVSFANLMPWRNLGGIGIVSMLAAVPSAFVGAHLTMHSLVVLPLSGMVYVTAYAALLLGFGLLSEGEKRSIADLLARYTGLRLVRGN